VPEPESIQKFTEISCRYRIRDILAEMEFWIKQMHMKCAQIIQELCVDLNRVGAFADNNPQAISLRDR
jgi:predicted XRE-type DNA-binding protein